MKEIKFNNQDLQVFFEEKKPSLQAEKNEMKKMEEDVKNCERLLNKSVKEEKNFNFGSVSLSFKSVPEKRKMSIFTDECMPLLNANYATLKKCYPFLVDFMKKCMG